MNTVIKAILKINPNAEVSVSADDINTIVWENGTTPIPKANIEAKIPEVELDNAMADLRQKRNAKLAFVNVNSLSNIAGSSYFRDNNENVDQFSEEKLKILLTAEQSS